MQKSGEVQSALARELAEYEMQVEKDVLAPMSSLLEVINPFQEQINMVEISRACSFAFPLNMLHKSHK